MQEVTTQSILQTIKEIRESLGLTQSQAAKASGISTSFYGMLERGNRSMSIEHLIQIAKVFDCNITDILEMTENSK